MPSKGAPDVMNEEQDQADYGRTYFVEKVDIPRDDVDENDEKVNTNI